MNFQKYMTEAWAKHERNTDEVLASYSEGLKLLQNSDDVLSLGRLISHVAIEHNFNFTTAVNYLEKLKQELLAQSSSTQGQLVRQIAKMKFISGQTIDVSNFSISDRTMIFISAAASYLFQKDLEKSEMLLNKAIAASNSLSDSKDPAYRTLAMSTNNMAAEISKKADLQTNEKKMMIDLAHHARYFWEKAGTWLNVERAEYYLSKYYRKTGDLRAAEHHAMNCLQICEKEKADPLEFFFAHEALALTFREKNNDIQRYRHIENMKHYFSQCKESDKTWLKDSLEALDAK